MPDYSDKEADRLDHLNSCKDLFLRGYEAIDACDIGNYLALCSQAKEDRAILDWIESKYAEKNWKLTGHITGTHSVREAVLAIINNPDLYKER